MRLKVSLEGISISVVGIPQLIEVFNAEYATLPKHKINFLKICDDHGIGDVVEIVTNTGDEYYIPHSVISEINGAAPNVSNALELFNTMNEKLYGFSAF